MSGILLQRVGGLSPVKQTHNKAPERYGVWAFVFPYFDPFFIGTTGPEGITERNTGESERYKQFIREGYRRFYHSGRLYTRITIPKSQCRNGWCLTDGITMQSYVGKFIAEVNKSLRNQFPSYPVRTNPYSVYAKDDWEVFVPNPEKNK